MVYKEVRSSRYRLSVLIPYTPMIGAICLILSLGTAGSARSLQEIKESGAIRICLADSHPAIATATPPGCRHDCTFKGPVYEASLHFATTLGEGVKAQFRRVEWDEQFHNKAGKTKRSETYIPELLASGTCDLYPSYLTRNAWREKKLDFVTLFPNRMMILINKKKKRKYKKSADLAGTTVAIAKNTSFHTWLLAQNKTTYMDAPIKYKFMSTAAAVKAVATGKADFTILDSELAIWTINKVKQVKLAFSVGEVEHLGWALRKQDKDLRAVVQQYFEFESQNPYSETNQNWKKNYGLSLIEFKEMVTNFK